MQTLNEAQAEVLAHELRSDASRPFLLGVVGPPGAGKSTFVESLSAPVLGMDGFHFADEHLDRLRLRNRKGAPETFDVGGYISILTRLRSGEDIVAPRFDRDLEAAIGGAVPVSGDARLVVTEGNYLLHDSGGWELVRPLLDAVWYLDVPDGLRIPRLISRHVSHGRSQDEATRWVNEVDQPNAALVLASRSRADAIITFTTQRGVS